MPLQGSVSCRNGSAASTRTAPKTKVVRKGWGTTTLVAERERNHGQHHLGNGGGNRTKQQSFVPQATRSVCHGLTTARMEIHGKHLDLTDAMKDYITQKVEHAVEKYESFVKKVDVKVSVHGGDAGKGAKQQKTEVTIFMKKGVVRAEAKEESLYASVDLVADKVSRRLRKVKEKTGIKAGKHRGSAVVTDMVDAEMVEDNEVPIYGEAQLPKEVVRTKYFFLEALDVDEALEQIKNIDHSFFVFRDKKTKEVQVLYKRNHGGYGLIIPMDSNAQVDEEEAELYSQPL